MFRGHVDWHLALGHDEPIEFGKADRFDGTGRHRGGMRGVGMKRGAEDGCLVLVVVADGSCTSSVMLPTLPVQMGTDLSLGVSLDDVHFGHGAQIVEAQAVHTARAGMELVENVTTIEWVGISERRSSRSKNRSRRMLRVGLRGVIVGLDRLCDERKEHGIVKMVVLCFILVITIVLVMMMTVFIRRRNMNGLDLLTVLLALASFVV